MRLPPVFADHVCQRKEEIVPRRVSTPLIMKEPSPPSILQYTISWHVAKSSTGEGYHSSMREYAEERCVEPCCSFALVLRSFQVSSVHSQMLSMRKYIRRSSLVRLLLFLCDAIRCDAVMRSVSMGGGKVADVEGSQAVRTSFWRSPCSSHTTPTIIFTNTTHLHGDNENNRNVGAHTAISCYNRFLPQQFLFLSILGSLYDGDIYCIVGY